MKITIFMVQSPGALALGEIRCTSPGTIGLANISVLVV